MLLDIHGRDEFARSYHLLRGRLSSGYYLPGDRIYIKHVSDELKLSPTPVREALARLVGEGVICDRRGSGYYVAALGPAEIAGLYGLQLLYVEQALRTRRRLQPGVFDGVGEPADRGSASGPVLPALEPLFERIFERSRNAILIDAARITTLRLDRVRAIESLIFTNIIGEARILIELGRIGEMARLKREIQHYFRRRARAAPALAAALVVRNGAACHTETSNNICRI